MYRIDSLTAVPVAPEIPPAQPEKFWGRDTTIEDWWLNMIQEEIRNVILAAGLTPTKSDNTQLSKAIDALITEAGLSVQTGSILWFAGDLIPAGYLECDGKAISRTQFNRLFSVLDTSFGVGDGATTFNLPDLRGRFVLGKDNMGGTSADRVIALQADTLGAGAGQDKVTLTVAQLPSHTHSYSVASSAGGGMNFNDSGDGNISTVTGSTGGNQPHNNMPPFITLKAIIKV